MIINKNNFHIYYAVVWVIVAIILIRYLLLKCDYDYYLFSLIIIAIAFGISMFVLPFFFDKNKGFILGPVFSLIVCPFFAAPIVRDQLYNGPSFICKFNITDYKIHKGKNPTLYGIGYYQIGEHQYYENIIMPSQNSKWIYSIFNFKCHSGLSIYKAQPSERDIGIIQDYAFVENDSIYTYHNYSLKQPDLVYYQVGFYVLYNAVCDTSSIADSTALLSFNDVCGKNHSVNYSVKGYQNIPDTFLVYRNINEKIDTQWHVCAPEVNTPENRAKISDYGYIFHYDVYSKQEIESQCPRIRDYVEQYKKRMTPNSPK